MLMYQLEFLEYSGPFHPILDYAHMLNTDLSIPEQDFINPLGNFKQGNGN